MTIDRLAILRYYITLPPTHAMASLVSSPATASGPASSAGAGAGAGVYIDITGFRLARDERGRDFIVRAHACEGGHSVWRSTSRAAR